MFMPKTKQEQVCDNDDKNARHWLHGDVHAAKHVNDI